MVFKNKLVTRVSETDDFSIKNKIQVVGWIPYWDQANAFESFKKNIGVFSTIEVFWYRLDKDGNIATYSSTIEDQSIIDTARKNNVKVMALVANLPDYEEGGEWDYKRVDKIISDPLSRASHITDLLSLVDKKNFDGITIDYEALKGFQKNNFSRFIQDLATALHSKGKLLGVAIHPKTSENDPKEDNGSRAQDLKRLSKSADHLYFMTYTQHAVSSQPGSLGSLSWIKKIIEYAQNLKVDKRKIYLGIGLFGLEWEKQGNSYRGVEDDLTYKDISQLIQGHGANFTSNPSIGARFDYIEEGISRVVWFDDVVTIQEKVAYAKQIGLGGIGIWRLGGEDEKVWNLFLSR